MRTVCRSLALLALLSLFVHDDLRGEDKKITPEQIEKAITQLGDKRFAVREKATRFLFDAGSLAEKPLQEAAKSNDPDVASRAKTILENFAWGIYPDSDPKLKEYIESYKKGDQQTRMQSLDQLLQLKPVPFKSLRKLIAREEDVELRRQQTARLADFARNAIPDLIRDDKLDEVEETFELLLSGSSGDLAGDYAAFMDLRNRVDAGIARFEKLSDAKDETGRNARLVLVFLHRIKREWPKAEKYAAIDSQGEIHEGVLLESSNWKELLKLAPKDRQVADLGYCLNVARLARDGDAEVEILKELRDPKEKVEADLATERLRHRAVALMMNHRGEEGIKLLLDARSELDMTFDLLVAQTRYEEAMALAEQATKLEMDRNRKVGFQLHRARLLFLLGDKDSAIQLFRKYGPASDEADANEMIYTLIRTEARLGLKALACEHLGAYLAKVDDNSRRTALESLLDFIYPSRGPLGQAIWLRLRELRPKEEHPKTVSRLKNLMEGKGKDELPALLAAAEDPKSKEENIYPTKDVIEEVIGDHQTGMRVGNVDRFQMLAELYALHGDDANTRKCFKRSFDVSPEYSYLRFGDYLFERRKYDEAIEMYRKASGISRSMQVNKILALAMEGRSLQLLGKKAEGQTRIDRAFWMPLANEHLRTELMREYQKRNWPEAARREAEMVLRTGELGSSQSFGALHHLANVATREKDYARSSDCYQRIALGILRIGGTFTEDSGFLAVPDAIEVARGLQLLKDGKLDEALSIAKSSQKLMPGNIDTVVGYVPELDRLKKTAEADAIYNPVRDVYLKILKDHPKSAFACNSLAWMMAACRRDLDDALKHAKNAVEFEPDNHGYLDTLAEVHFRRGEKAKAIELMKKCISMDPRKRYYRNQLDRFETLGMESDPPVEDED